MRATLRQVRSWVLAHASVRFWKGSVLTVVLVNLLGLAAFAYFSSGYFLEPEDGLSLDYGNAFAWGLTALPTFLLCVGLDLLWLVLIGIFARPPILWRLLLLWALVSGAWVIAIFPRPNHALQPTAGAGGVPLKLQPLQRSGGG